MNLWVKDQTVYNELLHRGLLGRCTMQHARRTRLQPCHDRSL